MDFVDESGNVNYAPYLTLFGGGFGATSSFDQAMESARLLRMNAGVAGLQGQSAIQTGAENAELYRQKLNQTIGRQQAQIGGANITTSGSALKALETTSELGAEDIARIQLNSARKAWGFQVSQQGDLMRADAANRAGWMQGAGSLINAGAKAWGQWDVPGE